MDADNEVCLLLKKKTFSLIQSARQFYIELLEAKDCGFKCSEIDPCKWTKHTSLRMVTISICFHDCLSIGTDEVIKEVIDANPGSKLKVEDDLGNYLSCKKVQQRDQGKNWVMKPHLIENLKKKFDDEGSGMYSYTTP